MSRFLKISSSLFFRTFLMVGVAGLYSNAAHAQLLTGYSNAPESAELDAKSDDVVATPSPETLAQEEVVVAEVRSVVSSPPPSSVVHIPQSSGFQPLMTGVAPKIPVQSSSQAAGQDSQKDPVDIQADQMSRNEGTNIVSAEGDVLIMQSGRILRADTVEYDLNQDVANAQGYVVLNEENGDIHLAQEAQYSNRLRDGRVVDLRSTLADGAKVKAREAELQGGTKTIMHDAAYTPCKICEEDPDDEPTWGLVASKVIHDKENHRVSYRNARFEAWGVPIAYTPYFSHPDGTIKQKSGLLAPSFGFRSELGAFVENNYYWAISPDQDLTIGAVAFTEEKPQGLLEYRKRWENAAFEIAGSVTSSERTDRTGGIDVVEDDETRGHVFAEGVWNMNDKWRSGVNVNWASDDQYVRQYDLSNEDVLVSELYTERFSGRDYASARLLSFQDIRIRETPLDQPDVLPEIVANFKGEPGAVPLVKGQWEVDSSIVGISRDGDEQDVQRFSLGMGWNRKLVSDYGLLTRVDASVRGDVFHTEDSLAAKSGLSSSSTDERFFPQFHVESSYPMIRPFENMQARVEPLVAFTAAPNLDQQDRFPNEDSNNVQIDTSNLFEPNRFPGLDRVEDETRVTYGFRSGLFGNDGSYGDVFLGQSYRFDENNNPFPEGSGLSEQESDIVGQITGSYKNIYDLDYKFQLASDTYTSERHEVDFFANWNRFRWGFNYLFAEALAGTDIEESREQFSSNMQYYFTPRWRARVRAIQDLGENPGLRKAALGLDYFGQCLFWGLTAQRNLTSDASGESDIEVLLRIGLKNLGEFEETTFKSDVPLEKSGCQ